MIQLKDIVIDKVASVGAGDNPEAQILFFKEHPMAKKVTAETIATLPEEVQEYIKGLVETKSEADKKAGMLSKIKEWLGDSKPEVEDVLKDADPAIKEAIAKAAQEASDAKAETAKLRVQIDRNHMFEIAKDLPGKADDIVSQLVKIKDALGEKEFDEYVTAQKALKTQVNVTKEIGAGDAGGSKGSDALEAIAKKLQDNDPDLSDAQAMDKALKTKDGREAYKEHERQKREDT